jgi:hypothetical protein
MRIHFLVAKVKRKVVDGEGESEGELGPEVEQAGGAQGRMEFQLST